MRWPAVFAALAALPGCGDSATSDPFDGLPLDGDFSADVDAPVHVARDRYGVAHIAAETLGDAAFVQGFVMAHDRLPQMDILRRFGSGRLAELYGALDRSVIDTDLEMRMHRMTPLAEQSWAILLASQDPIDRQVVQLVQRFTDGINRYAHDLQNGDWTIDPGLAFSFDPAGFAPWSPIDSLVLGRFQAFALSWTAPFEIDATELYQKLRAGFDNAPAGNPAAVARRGISRDLLKFTPVGREPTIAGFPNVGTDTGSRADGSAPPAARTAPRTAAAPASPPRPEVPQALLDAARGLFAPTIHDGPLGGLGPHALGHPFAGSNSWAVGPDRAGGQALLATDQHLQLTNPSIFYPTHLIVKDADGDPATADPIDVIGVTFPGIPGVILGSNGDLAWAATVAEHDVNDLYLEHIAPCPPGSAGAGGDCAAWTDTTGAARSVPLDTFTEDIAIGALGAITGHVTAIYEAVPHHGPILPAIDRAAHALIPRSSPTALSVSYTGYQPSFELRALYNLARATSVRDGFAALRDFRYGGQNWTMIDRDRHIGWTTQAFIPLRKPAAYAWDPLVRQDALAPFFALPGDGDGDWIPGAALSPRYIPHAVDPPQGYLVTANADPVGATFDGLPLDQAGAADQPLYVGATYAAGLREERITHLIQQGAPGGLALDDMARIQHDTHSSVGDKLAAPVRAALARIDSPDGTPADLVPYLAQLTPADRAQLATARGLLGDWTFATPPAIDAPDRDSAATALFNTWMHFFIARTLGDELAAVDFDVWRLDDNLLVRIVHAMLNDPKSMVASPATQQPILCDDYATPGPDTSCTVQVLAAMLDAMGHLASPQGFGTDDTAAWRWGALHRLTIAPLVPDAEHDLPAPGELAQPGFPRAGDNFAINRADHGWSDLDFSQRADGPAQRFLATTRAGAKIAVRWALPGGTIYDRRSPHYRDLLDRYYLANEHFDAPYSIDEIVRAGESRWVFH